MTTISTYVEEQGRGGFVVHSDNGLVRVVPESHSEQIKLAWELITVARDLLIGTKYDFQSDELTWVRNKIDIS